MRKTIVRIVMLLFAAALVLVPASITVGATPQDGPIQALQERVEALEGAVQNLLGRVLALESGQGGGAERTAYTKIIDPSVNGDVWVDYPSGSEGTFRAHYARFVCPDCSMADPPIVHYYWRFPADPNLGSFGENLFGDSWLMPYSVPLQYRDSPNGSGLEMLINYKWEYYSADGQLLDSGVVFTPEEDGSLMLRVVVVH